MKVQRLIDPSKDYSNFNADRLDRKGFADSLTQLLMDIEGPILIALNAPWGEGKTTFARMWQSVLKEEGFISVYFDAFENDYIDDPFTALSVQVLDLEKDAKSSDLLKRLNSFKTQAVKLGGKLAIWAAKVTVKGITLGAVGKDELDDLGDFGKEVVDGVSNAASGLIEKRFDEYNKTRESVQKFKEALAEVADQVQQETNHPLVIVIDELDRCRPDFSIELIEKIKHLFKVPNVVFVLVINKTQLVASIRHKYGFGSTDANLYLQKFIDVEMNLARKFQGTSHSETKEIAETLADRYGLGNMGVDRDLIVQAITGLGVYLDLSIRELEMCMFSIAFYYKGKGIAEFRVPELLAVISVVKLRDTELYRRLCNGEAGTDEVIDQLGLRNLATLHSEYETLSVIKDCLAYCDKRNEGNSFDNNPNLQELIRAFSKRGIRPSVAFRSYCLEMEQF